MRRIPPYAIFAFCGVLFLSLGMVIITADGVTTVPVTELPPEASNVLPTDVPPVVIDAPPVDAGAQQPPAPPVEVQEQPPAAVQEQPPAAVQEQPPAPPAEVQVQPPPADVVQPPPATEVLPVEPTLAETVPTLEGVIVAESAALAGQPTPVIPAVQPTAAVVPQADLQATAVVAIPATLVPPVAQSLGTLPPPSNTLPVTAAVLTAQVYGQVIVPLRADFTGVVITLTLPDGSALQTATDSRGVFNFANLPAGTYRVDAGITGYLSSQFTFALVDGQALTLPPATLIGGDTNLDNRIDLSDAVLIAANFNIASTTPADLNNDGIVDIRDLTAIGAYFGQAGPVAWQ